MIMRGLIMSRVGKVGFMASKKLFKQIAKEMAKKDYTALDQLIKETKLSDSDVYKLSHAIQTKPMQWHSTGDALHPYRTKFETHDLRLQLNNFPEESFCTVQRNLSNKPHEPASFEHVQDIVEFNGYEINWEMIDGPNVTSKP